MYYSLSGTIRKLTLGSTFLLLFSSCANIMQPSGGEQDHKAPGIVAEFPANGSTSFNSKKIIIRFDEFINLNELNKNLVISPPLEKKPEISVHKKEIEIKLDAYLAENTTYTISFGSAITDIHENNPLLGYSYYFSTGPVIDSSSVGGFVLDALTQKKQADITIGLYKTLDDSTIYKQSPLYIASSAENGMYLIRHVRNGKYRLAGFMDENKNKKADRNELLCFYPNELSLSDSLARCRLFTFKQDLYAENTLVDSFAVKKDLFCFVFYKLASDTRIKVKDIASYNWHIPNEFYDSLFVALAPNEQSYPSFQLETATGKTEFTLNNKLDKWPALSVNIPNSISAQQALVLEFSNPLSSFNKDSIRLFRDTIALRINRFVLDSLSKRQISLYFDNNVEEAANYLIRIGNAAFRDIHGQVNTPELASCRKQSKTEFGTIEFKIKNPNKKPVIIQLLDSKDIIQKELYNTESLTHRFINLIPAQYKLRIIEDQNRNGIWDNGDIIKGRSPERVRYLSTSYQVRADWDFDDNLIDIEAD